MNGFQIDAVHNAMAEKDAEIARLRAEVERLKAERQTTKLMLEDILEKHGQPRP